MSRIVRALMLFAFAVALGLFGFASIARTPKPGYVGREACRQCHETVNESYRQVSMSRTFDRMETAEVIEDWTGDNRFYHKASDQHFVMFRRDGKYFQRRYKLDPKGNQTEAFEREIHFTIGSGNQERDYFYLSEAGELIQMPVVWYT
ncbi:MAG: hypothetical protein HY646_21915, partial [Acidobacteria bacterium]|nr:hypothetical protein [Acidobacteriota bacterium]